MNNKILKKFFLAIIVILFLASLTNYTNSSKNLDDQAYVMAIGFDKGTTSKYKISFQLSTLESSKSESSVELSKSNNEESSASGSSSSSNFIINTVETNSIDNGINIINSYLNKNVELSHCKTLVISEDLAKEGVRNVIDSLINKVEVRPDCIVIISRIPDDEFSNKSEASIEKNLHKFYEVTSNTETGRGYSELVLLNDFYLDLNDEYIQPYATLGIVHNTTSKKNSETLDEYNKLDVQSQSFINIPSEISIETLGLAIFKDDVMVGTLTANETLCQEILINNLNYCSINISSPFSNDETIDLQIASLKAPKIKVNIENNIPQISLNISISAKILSFNTRTDEKITEDSLNIIKDSTIKFLERQFYDYCYKTSREFKTDIIGAGRYAARNFLTIPELKNYNWIEKYPLSNFNVNVSASIKSGHLITNE